MKAVYGVILDVRRFYHVYQEAESKEEAERLAKELVLNGEHRLELLDDLQVEEQDILCVDAQYIIPADV